MLELTVFLSGEVHSDWRDQLVDGAAARGLPIEFLSPVTVHEASDAAGDGLGPDPGPGPGESGFWRDHKSAKVNAMRIRTAIEQSDIVVVRFGEAYRQWNAAFDAGYAAAMGKSLIVMHPPEFTHALKEVDAGASAVAETPEQVLDILAYVATQK
jgi:YtoQ family protein